MIRRTLRALLAALVVASLLAACTSSDDDAADPSATSEPRSGGGDEDRGDSDDGEGSVPEVVDGIRIEVVSSQPDRATGPDARIRVSPAPGGRVEDLVVTLDDQDVTGQLEPVDGALEGVLVGLIEGTNTVRARSGSEPDETATQRIRSWPLTGPMISGPHTPLLVCSTEEHGLGGPTDDDCSAPTRVTWSYVSTSGEVRPLEQPEARPADMATVEAGPPDGDSDGDAADEDEPRTVPFVLRRERGVLNRSVYDIVTVDPSPGGPDADNSDAAWNGRLVYRFGGGCATTYGQGRSLTLTDDVDLLAEGYALATATFNTGAVQCNDVVSAETAMMVKERFIEAFGRPELTIGEGTSGGGIQVHLIAQNYPGLLDGGLASESFPDWITALAGITDCGLLQRWYATPTGAALTPGQRAAVNGHSTAATCGRWTELFAGVLDPGTGCDPGIDPAAVYDPASNPSGVRCTYHDAAVNVFGADPATGFAHRPLDNVGVQYGLDALNDRTITFEQFIALNREVGGYDVDGGHQVARHEAEFEPVALAYETGRVSAGAGDQTAVPIIEVDIWNDPSGDVHDHFRPFSLRDRLVRGRSPSAAPGFQIWTREPAGTDEAARTAALSAAVHDGIATLDEWLSGMEGDTGRGDRAAALERNRPDAAIDNCVLPGRERPVSGVHVYDDDGDCRERYPISGDPRIAAGAPLADDVIKCSLKAVDPADYDIPITDRRYEDLLEVFPQGVCDWQEVGVGQTAPSLSDRTFEDVITPEQMA